MRILESRLQLLQEKWLEWNGLPRWGLDSFQEYKAAGRLLQHGTTLFELCLRGLRW